MCLNRTHESFSYKRKWFKLTLILANIINKEVNEAYGWLTNAPFYPTISL
ncbi:hypothetical protein RchiOBHm_Chr5g0018781 [Rosa chinensis]|uniref:Uncharacterized protein n=1 Tax=Rosa chinensis TaxID=74649 RepID=A0A2P6Q6V3_ROSCH|nr:hypothetical protein RchiOBHm_Chr5g0018781 [Rosa chinensis]